MTARTPPSGAHKDGDQTEPVFNILNEDGTVVDLRTATKRILDVAWNNIKLRAKRHGQVTVGKLSKAEMEKLAYEYYQALKNATTYKEYLDYSKNEYPLEIENLIENYKVWRKHLKDIEEGERLLRGRKMSEIRRTSTQTESSKSIGVGNPVAFEIMLDPKESTSQSRDSHIESVSDEEEEVYPNGAKGHLDITRIKSTTPRVRSSIRRISTLRRPTKETRRRRGQDEWSPGRYRREESPRLAEKISDLTQIIQVLANTTLSQGGGALNYTVAPRPKYHLVDLKTFTGKAEDYPVWRQNLEICLERETFKDEKDKALFVINHLSGAPYDHCKYYVRKLTDASYMNMIKKLDRNYGSTKALDMSIIMRLYKLPKVTFLSKDNLDIMITVIESAMEPLESMDPTALTNPYNEKYLRLLSLIPPTDQDMYDTHCIITNQEPNLKTFLEFLYKKHDIRRTTEELSKQVVSSKTILKMEEIDRSSSDTESEEVYAFQDQAKQSCGACKGPHGLAVCEKFKKLTLDEKRAIVDKSRACSSCLRVGHFVRTCRLRKRCTVTGCQRFHHPWLHDDQLMRILYFEEVGGFPEESQ